MIAYVCTKVVMFIVFCICSALSCRLSAQFCPQLPHGCFACCCLNMSFIHIPLLRPKTLPAVCADLVNPWISRNISLISGAVMFSRIYRKLLIIPVIILKNKGCFVPVTADTVRIKLPWKFVNYIKYNNFLFFLWQNFRKVKYEQSGGPLSVLYYYLLMLLWRCLTLQV